MSFAHHLYLNDEEIIDLVIPNSVTSIGNSAFYDCSSLTSVTIPNSVTSIGSNAFQGCSGLTSVTIPNSVTFIGNEAFIFCSGLTSVGIPNSVTSIGRRAFDGIDLVSIVSYITEPFKITGKNSDNRTFTLNTFNNATLYVPVGTIDKYKATEGWKDFVFMEEGTGGGEGPATPEKCATPTISYQNGKLTFDSTTEGATCQYSITDTDIKAGSGNEVELTATYVISVYATKAGYEKSETATATLCWIDVDPRMEDFTNSMASVPAHAVLIQGSDGVLHIAGVDEGTSIAVYSVSGQMVGTAKAKGRQTSLDTNIKKGEVAIIKIGEKSVKVVMQ